MKNLFDHNKVLAAVIFSLFLSLSFNKSTEDTVSSAVVSAALSQTPIEKIRGGVGYAYAFTCYSKTLEAASIRNFDKDRKKFYRAVEMNSKCFEQGARIAGV